MTPAYPTVGEVLEEVVLVVDASWGCRRRWSSGMACILVSWVFKRLCGRRESSYLTN